MACRAPYRNPIHPIFPNRTCTVRQSDSQVGQYIRASMGPPGWQGRLCVGSFLSRVCSGITQRARADAAPALAVALFWQLGGGRLCGAGCRCRCRLLGLQVAVMREDGFELPTTCSSSSHNTSVHFTQPPFRHAAEIRGRVSAPRSGFCRRPCRRIRRDRHSHRSGPRHSVCAERHEVKFIVCSGPGRDPMPYDFPLSR